LVELLGERQRGHVAALAREGTGGARRPGDGLRHPERVREDLDLLRVLGVVRLPFDSVDLQKRIEWHGWLSFPWRVGVSVDGRRSNACASALAPDFPFPEMDAVSPTRQAPPACPRAVSPGCISGLVVAGHLVARPVLLVFGLLVAD